ncbi:hypothetical protein L211DRAFT_489861 [Terfezia boudieri ATCC MYA-4762]|uniref:Uncharacterized protein n=1 Tax=Terfezia boudieri ATCC MYA-4762 TaxID=1051890 RepID=A0A3N4LDG2_9PEZI|nr:hypothetical protein L211DRAFT_489861 [Terfezia boudieri ATCC MYA-4762]
MYLNFIMAFYYFYVCSFFSLSLDITDMHCSYIRTWPFKKQFLFCMSFFLIPRPTYLYTLVVVMVAVVVVVSSLSPGREDGERWEFEDRKCQRKKRWD